MLRVSSNSRMLAAIGGFMFSFRRPRSTPFAPANRARKFSFTDVKVVAGVSLVLASIVIGALVFRHDETKQQVWQATRDLPAGASVSESDFTPTMVDLAAVGESYSVEPATGTLTRSLRSGELLPVDAIGTSESTDQRLVTLPVEPLHAPELTNGDEVDVWTTSEESGASTLVLEGVHVVSITTDVVGAGGESGVVVSVTSDDAGKLVAAVRSGVIDVVKAPVL